MKPGKCKSCGAAILWVEIVNGNMMALDSRPVEDGNISIRDGKAHVVNGGRSLFEEQASWPRFKSHFATCPNARTTHRKKGAK